MLTDYFQPGPLLAYAVIVALITIRHRRSLPSLAAAEHIARTAFAASFATSLAFVVHTLLNLPSWEDLGPSLGFSLLLPLYASITYTVMLLLHLPECACGKFQQRAR